MSRENVLGLLVTAPEALLQDFHYLICIHLNKIDRRKQTVRYTCMAEDLPLAMEAAGKSNVTLQKIVVIGQVNEQTIDLGDGGSVTVSDNVERYDVLHEGTHKMKYEPRVKT